MHTVPLRPSQISACAEIATRAYADDDFFLWLRPHAAAHLQHWRHWYARRLRWDLAMPDWVVHVCVSDDGDPWWDESVGEEVLGWTAWERRWGTSSEEAERRRRPSVWSGKGFRARLEAWAVQAEQKYADVLQMDKSVDPEALLVVQDRSRMYDEVVEGQLGQKQGLGHIWLHNLCTDPRFQRKGVGKRLLRWGLDRGSKEQVPLGLVASPMGSGLYGKVGFEEVGIIEIGPCRDKVMVRWSRATAKPEDVEVKREVEGAAEAIHFQG